MLPFTALATQGSPPAGCSDAPLETAVEELFPGASLVAVDELGATVLLPVIYPGVRFRLVGSDGLWCDAMRAYNVAAEGSALEIASAYAKVGSAPWFDGVTIQAAQELVPGVVTLTTHSLVNGVVAEWVVLVDGRGVERASWTAVGFAVEPFVAHVEGFTALPGLSREFVRSPAGLLEPVDPIFGAVVTPTLGTASSPRMSDTFRMVFHFAPGGSTVYPTAFEPLPNDVIRNSAMENYEEFLSWGLVKGWSSNTGNVFVDDDVALSCLACVFISQDFNIHIFSGVVAAIEALGQDWEDDRLAMSTIVGHEMFHNFQNAYYKPAGSATFVDNSFIEGTARFQETLHEYSHVSHTSGSLVYAADGNGCNDELGVQSSAAPNLYSGPSTAQTYSACDFWLTWYGEHGLAGVKAMLQVAGAHKTKTGWNEVKSIVEDATNAPIDEDLARFATAILSGENMVWGPAAGSGPALDWGQFLDGWAIPNLAKGSSIAQTITDGGMMGARVFQDGVITVDTGAVQLYEIKGGAFTPIASGASIEAPAWIVATYPGVGSATPRLSYA